MYFQFHLSLFAYEVFHIRMFLSNLFHFLLDRSEHFVAFEPGECRRVQLRPRLRVLHPQEPHLSRFRDARAKLVRLPQAQQVSASASQVHQAYHAAGNFQFQSY